MRERERERNVTGGEIDIGEENGIGELCSNSMSVRTSILHKFNMFGKGLNPFLPSLIGAQKGEK